MDSNYHVFKKAIQSKGKTIHKWYCYWNDPATSVMHQKVCKGCKTQAEAFAFVSALPPLFHEEKITIAKIAERMYIPGGTYLKRMRKLGKTYTIKPENRMLNDGEKAGFSGKKREISGI